MADAAVALRPELAAQSLKVTIRGKLVEQRRSDGSFYSVLLAAAGDEFSQPMPFEIRSSRSLGERNQVCTVECKVGGYYKRSYNFTDKHTGEVRRVRPIALALDAVEDNEGGFAHR